MAALVIFDVEIRNAERYQDFMRRDAGSRRRRRSLSDLRRPASIFLGAREARGRCRPPLAAAAIGSGASGDSGDSGDSGRLSLIRCQNVTDTPDAKL